MDSALCDATTNENGAKEMFKTICEYMKLSNCSQNRGRRISCTDSLVKLAGEVNSTELFLQLLKQSRENHEPDWEKNIWKLMGKIAERKNVLGIDEVKAT